MLLRYIGVHIFYISDNIFTSAFRNNPPLRYHPCQSGNRKSAGNPAKTITAPRTLIEASSKEKKTFSNLVTKPPRKNAGLLEGKLDQ